MAFTVVDYVLRRLTQQGVDTLFGVPAVYCAPLYESAPAHAVRAIVTTSDLEAGYAADGYARSKGLAAVSVANGVGTLSLINAIGGAFVERSPVVVINGGPTAGHLADQARLDVVYSHSTGRDATDLNAFALVTAFARRAATVAEVPDVVDTAISTALRTKRPVYIEIDMGLWSAPCQEPGAALSDQVAPAGTETQLANTIVGLIRAAQRPVLLVGTEVQRYGLADAVADLIAKLGIRWASDMLAKSTLPESGAGWIGVYDPPYVPADIRQPIEQADLLVTLGSVFPNAYAPLVNTAFNRMVAVYDGKVRVKSQPKQNAEIRALVAAMRTKAAQQPPATPPAGAVPTIAGPPPAGPLTYRGVFERIGVALDATLFTIADTFLGVYSAANLPVRDRDAFLSDPVWASIGHSVAAAVGVSFGSARRPLVVCGDGGFQMTAQSLSTMARYGRNPIVVVIENGIYGFEQYLLGRGYFSSAAAPKPYVRLGDWDLAKFAASVGIPAASEVATAADLDSVLAAAKAHQGPYLIAAKVDSRGLPAELPR